MTEVLSTAIGLILATGLVLVLAYVCLRLLKRFQPGRREAGGVEFMRSIAVGPRERVTLIRYREEVFMLGVATGSVRLLARFRDGAQGEGALESLDENALQSGASA